mmetsp:Transcript_14915/g.37154  ORF Transcript_14915/g.37154 Transcript_14915/m.37154 type:complete len:248 (+) Transcript_14915:141-884(+)
MYSRSSFGTPLTPPASRSSTPSAAAVVFPSSSSCSKPCVAPRTRFIASSIASTFACTRFSFLRTACSSRSASSTFRLRSDLRSTSVFSASVWLSSTLCKELLCFSSSNTRMVAWSFRCMSSSSVCSSRSFASSSTAKPSRSSLCSRCILLISFVWLATYSAMRSSWYCCCSSTVASCVSMAFFSASTIACWTARYSCFLWIISFHSPKQFFTSKCPAEENQDWHKLSSCPTALNRMRMFSRWRSSMA